MSIKPSINYSLLGIALPLVIVIFSVSVYYYQKKQKEKQAYEEFYQEHLSDTQKEEPRKEKETSQLFKPASVLTVDSIAKRKGYSRETERVLLPNLWNTEVDVTDSVSAAMSYFRKFLTVGNTARIPRSLRTQSMLPYLNENTEDYFRKTGNHTYYKFMIFLFRNRQQINLVGLYNTYKGLLPGDDSFRELVHNSGLGKTCLQLIEVYDNLYYTQDYHVNFQKVYDVMTHHQGVEAQFEAISEFMYTLYSEHFVTHRNEIPYLNKELVVWAYSFWARRYKEGTLRDVHYILMDFAGTYVVE